MDVKWWQEHELPTIEAIDKYGRLAAFDGKKIQDARHHVTEKLKHLRDFVILHVYSFTRAVPIIVKDPPPSMFLAALQAHLSGHKRS